MANLNRVILICRLTRDPEARSFANGKVVNFGVAVNNSHKDKKTGEWLNDPCFLDVEAWNRGDFNKLADRAEDLQKGKQILLEGHLKQDNWEDKTTGQKRSKIKVVMDNFQYLDPKGEGQPAAKATSGGDEYSNPPVDNESLPF